MDDPSVPVVDLETTPVPHQESYALMDLHGQVLKGDLQEKDSRLLFQMLADVGALSIGKFRRLTVTLGSSRYVVTRDSQFVYAVLATEA
jgi:hypothetical protein